MNKLISARLLLVIAMLVPVAAAAEKISVVDIQTAILKSEYGKQELDKLKEDPEVSELVAEVDVLAADLQALDKDAQSNNAKWGADKVAEYQKKRQFLVADLQLNQQKIQAEQKQVVQEINAVMNDAARQALEELVAEEGITLLLNKNTVLLVTTAHDITDKLAAKLAGKP